MVYHGSPDARGLFKEGFRSFHRDAFFFTDSYTTALSYADPKRAFDYQGSEPLVVPVYLRIENPLVIEGGGARWRDTEHHLKLAREGGHDGLVIRASLDDYHNLPKSKPSTVYAIFSPSQAKSAYTQTPRSSVDRKPLPWAGPNDGSFDLDDPDLRSNHESTVSEAFSGVRMISSYKLKKALTSSRVYTLLDAFESTRGGSPLAGGCWPVAEALHRVLPGSSLYVVNDALRGPQHVVVSFEGRFYDADGASTEEEMLQRWNEIEDLIHPSVQPLTAGHKAWFPGVGMSCPGGLVEALEGYLRRVAGRPC